MKKLCLIGHSFFWCEWRDLNPHVVRRRILSPVRLPFRHTRMPNFIVTRLFSRSQTILFDDQTYRAVVTAFNIRINKGFF